MHKKKEVKGGSTRKMAKDEIVPKSILKKKSFSEEKNTLPLFSSSSTDSVNYSSNHHHHHHHHQHHHHHHGSVRLHASSFDCGSSEEIKPILKRNKSEDGSGSGNCGQTGSANCGGSKTPPPPSILKKRGSLETNNLEIQSILKRNSLSAENEYLLLSTSSSSTSSPSSSSSPLTGPSSASSSNCELHRCVNIPIIGANTIVNYNYTLDSSVTINTEEVFPVPKSILKKRSSLDGKSEKIKPILKNK